MSKPPLLILGSIVQAIFERVETARLLGFEPIGVQLDGTVGDSTLTCYTVADLPDNLRGAPCIVGSWQSYPDLIGSRFDRKNAQSLRRLVQAAENAGFNNWIALVHPSAQLSPSAKLGKGVFVGPLVSIANDTNVGEFALIGRSSSIGHHVLIGDYSAIGPGAVIPGRVNVGSDVHVGNGASVINGIRVSNGSLIGAGSVVTKHVNKGRQVMGNPARALRRPIPLLRKHSRNLLRSILIKTGLYNRALVIYKRIFR